MKNIFFNGDSNEETCVEQHVDFVFLGHEKVVYKLVKSFYNLKQTQNQ